MLLFFVSFLAGVLTVLAPCVLPLLPIIIGGSAQNKRNPYVITASLAVAIVVFTLLLKFSTLFINIPQSVWNGISGAIIILFGLISLFPEKWDEVSLRLGLSKRSEQLLADSAKAPSRWSDVLIGLSLGPVFSSCSPTYFLILATVLPRSFAAGTIYLIAYALGLCLVLLLVSLLGQRFIRKAGWAADPRGWFKRGLGILFILVGVFILTGADKRLQTFLLEKGYFNITNVEQSLLKKVEPPSMMPEASTASMNFPRYQEIVGSTGFVNTEGITLGELVGKKVILVDFMTYSCINCIRTFPYLNAWYEKYKGQGLEIVGIHTPEFAFEKKIENVEAAMKRYGIRFPIILDNNYATWNAYQNNYWPRKYLIDINGKVVYDHIGEGGYEETEEKIQELLREKMVKDGQEIIRTPQGTVDISTEAGPTRGMSPETYFGSLRNATLANGNPRQAGLQSFSAQAPFVSNRLYLDGEWNIQEEFAQNMKANASVIYAYRARDVFFVARSRQFVEVKIFLDGKAIPKEWAGADIFYKDDQSYVRVQEDRLYSLIKQGDVSEGHVLRLDVLSPGLEAYTFTFG